MIGVSGKRPRPGTGQHSASLWLAPHLERARAVQRPFIVRIGDFRLLGGSVCGCTTCRPPLVFSAGGECCCQLVIGWDCGLHRRRQHVVARDADRKVATSRYCDTVQWIADVVVPLIVGLLAAFGATWYSNKKNAERLERDADDRAANAIRTYIRALRETSDYLEAQASTYDDWDATADVISHGGKEAVRAAYDVASPHFHRLDVREEDGNPLRNEFPGYGAHPIEGAGNFHVRAEQIQSILARGLKH